MKTFRSSPATIVVEKTPRDEVMIGSSIGYEPGSVVGVDSPVYITLEAFGGEQRHYRATELVETSTGWWEGTTFPNKLRFYIRPTTEYDAVSSLTTASLPHIPMPIPVLAAWHGDNGDSTMPTIWAMSEDDGFVGTMMLSTDTGMYVRYSGAWHLLTDEDVVDGLTATEVEDSGLDLFDQFDRAGQLVHVTAMPAKSPLGAGVEILSAEAPVTVTASVDTMEVPTLDVPEELPAAIEAAASNPEIRWWVERRARALGLEADFPWNDRAQ